MADKVTLWRISNGMHYSTQAAAELAEAQAELEAYLSSQGSIGSEIQAMVRLCLGTWEGMPATRDRIEAAQPIDPEGKGRGRVVTRERGAAVLARFAMAIAKHADTLPHEAGSRAEADAAARAPEPVQVAEPVRRRAIRSPREPDTPEGDSPGPVDFDSLPRPSARRSNGW